MTANRGLNFGNIGLNVFAEQSQQIDVITNSVKEADEELANILIFPELSINHDMLASLERSLSSTTNLNLVVAGSYYKESPGSAYKNISTDPPYVRAMSLISYSLPILHTFSYVLSSISQNRTDSTKL